MTSFQIQLHRQNVSMLINQVMKKAIGIISENHFIFYTNYFHDKVSQISTFNIHLFDIPFIPFPKPESFYLLHDAQFL
jgi:hypothetical protein